MNIGGHKWSNWWNWIRVGIQVWVILWGDLDLLFVLLLFILLLAHLLMAEMIHESNNNKIGIIFHWKIFFVFAVFWWIMNVLRLLIFRWIHFFEDLLWCETIDVWHCTLKLREYVHFFVSYQLVLSRHQFNKTAHKTNIKYFYKLDKTYYNWNYFRTSIKIDQFRLLNIGVHESRLR